jgi:hypothetical protein
VFLDCETRLQFIRIIPHGNLNPLPEAPAKARLFGDKTGLLRNTSRPHKTYQRKEQRTPIRRLATGTSATPALFVNCRRVGQAGKVSIARLLDLAMADQEGLRIVMPPNFGMAIGKIQRITEVMAMS